MCAELAGIDVRQVVADGASSDGPLDLQNGFRQLRGIGLIHFENEKRKALSRFCSDARKFFELFDEPADGFCDVHLLEQTWNLKPARHIAELALHYIVDFTNALVYRSYNQ